MRLISDWGAPNKRAEIILIEPAPGNAGEGMERKLDYGGLKTQFNLPGFNLKTNHYYEIQNFTGNAGMRAFLGHDTNDH